MSNFVFSKATKKKARLRMALVGPSGSGKTYSALAIATGLGGKIAVIDTEHGSASKYANLFNFDVLEPDSFGPLVYVDIIHAAEKAGYDVLVIDSLSHAWMGKDGALEQVDNASKRSQSGNSYVAWRNVTPQHNALVEAMITSKCHIIATMRAKTEYATEKDDRGKTVIRKIGLAPIQRDGLEYEFDVTGDLALETNDYVISKTRCPELAGRVFPKPGANLAEALKAWLTDGADVPVAPAPAPSAPAARPAIAPTQAPAAVPHPTVDLAEVVEQVTALRAEVKGIAFGDETETGRVFLADSAIEALDAIEGLPPDLRGQVVADMMERYFAACASQKELDEAAAIVKKNGLQNGSRKRALDAYNARKAALKAPPADTVAA